MGSTTFAEEESAAGSAPESGEEAIVPAQSRRSPLFGVALGAGLALVLVLAGTLAYLGANGGVGAGTGGLKVEPRVGSLAPDFHLTDLSTGQPVTLSALKGRPVWINFWATWCAACKEEMPRMKQTYARYKDKGLAIVGIDVQESRDAVAKYIAGGGYDWTFAIDTDGKVADRYYVGGLPAHWFVDKSGVLKATYQGGIPQDQVDSYVSQITGP